MTDMTDTTIRIHVTLAEDGFGDDATDDDRWSFRAYVEERVEALHPGAVCTTEIANVLGTTVAAPASIDAAELASLVGNEFWEEWCSGSRAASESAS